MVFLVVRTEGIEGIANPYVYKEQISCAMAPCRAPNHGNRPRCAGDSWARTHGTRMSALARARARGTRTPPTGRRSARTVAAPFQGNEIFFSVPSHLRLAPLTGALLPLKKINRFKAPKSLRRAPAGGRIASSGGGRREHTGGGAGTAPGVRSARAAELWRERVGWDLRTGRAGASPAGLGDGPAAASGFKATGGRSRAGMPNR